MTVNHMIDILQFIYRGGSSPSPRANYLKKKVDNTKYTCYSICITKNTGIFQTCHRLSEHNYVGP